MRYGLARAASRRSSSGTTSVCIAPTHASVVGWLEAAVSLIVVSSSSAWTAPGSAVRQRAATTRRNLGLRRRVLMSAATVSWGSKLEVGDGNARRRQVAGRLVRHEGVEGPV